MAVTVPFEVTRECEVKAPLAEVFAVLSDVPKSASHFPQVERLVDLGGNAYRWELRRVGTQQVGLQTVYASKYVSDRKAGTVSWTPVEGVGNGRVSGRWTLTDRKGSTHLRLQVHGELTVPLPGMAKMLVAPVVTSENEKLIDKYIDNLATRFGRA